MILEMIFKGALTGISGLSFSKVFEKYLAERIPFIGKIIKNYEIPNEKLVELIKVTVNQAFEVYNKKHKGKYLDIFENENNLNVIIDSFNYESEILTIDSFSLQGFGYTKKEVSEAVKDFIEIFNRVISETTLLSIINGIKKFINESRTKDEILFYLKDEMGRLSEVNKKLLQSNQNKNEYNFDENFGQIALAYGESIINLTQNIYVNEPKENDYNCGEELSGSWEKVRNEVYRYLKKGQSVNLVSKIGSKWRELTLDIKKNFIKEMGIIDISHPINYSRKRFVKTLLDIRLENSLVPEEPDDMVFLGEKFYEFKTPLVVALNNFDIIVNKKYYDLEFYSALKSLVMDDRKLVLLINSHKSFSELISLNNPCSDLNLVNIEFSDREKIYG